MIMKKIIFIILFFPLFSCNDGLEVESEVSVTYRNYFQNEQDIEQIFATMCGAEKKIYSNWDTEPMAWTSLYCDNIPASIEGYQTLNPSLYETTKISWSSYYNIIYFANMLEENRYRFENVTKERADFWIAQANFLKGLMYFEIARRWGEAPIAPGSEDAKELAKSPVDSVLAQAIRAAEAALILPTHDKLKDAKGNTVNSRQYASLGSVHTLLANIYAWMGGLYGDNKYWEKAEQEASFVLDGKAGSYDLVSLSDLVTKTFGSPRNTTEVIHAIEINSQDEDRFMQGKFTHNYPGMAFITYPYASTDYKLVTSPDGTEMTRIKVETIMELYSEPEDLRLKEFWYRLGQKIIVKEDDPSTPEDESIYDEPSEYGFINKWRETIFSVNPDVNEGGRKLLAMDGNIIYWRLADLILLRAECRAHLDMANAVQDLNRVRQRAGLGGYKGALDKKTLLREIFNERDRELFGEICRYFDVVRNGYFQEIFKGNFKTLTDEDIKDGALYLPVGGNAYRNNTLMKQNTYWSWHLVQ